MNTIQLENINQPLPSPSTCPLLRQFPVPPARPDVPFQPRAQSKGLLLVEARDSRLDTAIHMLFVFMDLAVIWINSEKVVVDTVLARAWRPAYAPRQPARYILEIHPSRLGEFKIGDQR